MNSKKIEYTIVKIFRGMTTHKLKIRLLDENIQDDQIDEETILTYNNVLEVQVNNGNEIVENNEVKKFYYPVIKNATYYLYRIYDVNSVLEKCILRKL
jgi:hypothetical protein